jgi:tRNA-specific 2-thiouridylase
LLSPRLQAVDVSWVAGEPPAPDTWARLAAKSRYRQVDAPCRYVAAADGSTASFGLDFAEPQWAVTPGQSAVVYDGEVCLGGGIITAAA